MTTPPELLNFAGYAKRCGLTAAAIYKAVNSGRLKKAIVRRGGRRLLDVAIADAEMAARTDVAQAERSRAQRATLEHQRERAARQAAQARALEHEVRELEAGLLNAQAVRQRHGELCEQTRAILIGMAERLAEPVAAERDERRVLTLIDREVFGARKRIAAACVAKPESGPRAEPAIEPSDARARLELLRRRISETRLAERQGVLVRREAVDRAIQGRLVGIVQNLEALGDSVAPLLAATSDPAKVRDLLERRIREAVRGMDDALTFARSRR